MSAVRTYLDWNASAPLRPEARAAMIAALDAVGNASSVHAEGRRVRALVEQARERVARLVGAKPSEVVFTSGATEANNWALSAEWDLIFVCGIEHASVLAPACRSAARVIEFPAGSDGVAQVERIAEFVLRSSDPLGRALVSLQMANNETGVIQPLSQTAMFAREHGLSVHTDATQAAGRLPIDFRALGVDLLSISSHKIGGPKGAGALVIREGSEIEPFVVGGGQERRRRAGTEDVAAIAGFGRGNCCPCGSAAGARDSKVARSPRERDQTVCARYRCDRCQRRAAWEHRVFRLAWPLCRDACHQARPRRHRRQCRFGVLLGQGRREPCSCGNGRAERHRARCDQGESGANDRMRRRAAFDSCPERDRADGRR
jgi:cysteine sulfinate desulfinase/cysteine desulfurase-like protein